MYSDQLLGACQLCIAIGSWVPFCIHGYLIMTVLTPTKLIAKGLSQLHQIKRSNPGTVGVSYCITRTGLQVLLPEGFIHKVTFPILVKYKLWLVSIKRPQPGQI